MTKPRISIVVAITEKTRAIGRGPNLLFRISDDLKRFKTLTLGHPIIMGRKTYESIGKPLPGRTNIVITRNPDFTAEGITRTGSLEEAIEIATKIETSQENSEKTQEIFIIGGGEIYTQAIEKKLVDRLYLSIIKKEADADIFFPEYERFFPKTVSVEDRIEATTGINYAWVVLEK